MEFENTGLILRYEAHGASSYDPCLQFLIMKQGNAVSYRTEATRYDTEGPDHFLFISDEAAASVQAILSEDRLYLLEEPERSRDNWGPSHTYDFYFSSGEREVSYFAYALEYIAGREDCPKVNYLYDVLGRLGEVLISEGVPEECFLPCRRVLDAPVEAVPYPVSVFTVYDLGTSPEMRMTGGPGSDVRLEKYALEKRNDGSFALAVQLGWPGGSGHWDGSGNSFLLPLEWFSESFEEFIVKLTERFPEERYGYGPEELSGITGLREFLGFKSDE